MDPWGRLVGLCASCASWRISRSEHISSPENFDDGIFEPKATETRLFGFNAGDWLMLFLGIVFVGLLVAVV